MSKARKAPRIIAVDCETDPFRHDRVPVPFIWGAHDGERYWTFRKTDDFVAWLREQDCIAYAHNGGKFDFIFLLPYLDDETKARVIGGRFAEMKMGRSTLRDSYSIVPVALREIQKDDIDYALMEAENREQNMEEITKYLYTDVRVLWLLVTAFRTVAGKALTIASNALASAKALGVNPGRTNFRFDQNFREFYHGGRTECFQPGEHKDVCVYDIRSSYPFAMSQHHASGDRVENYSSLKGLSENEIGRAFISLRCYSDGAFPLSTDTGLSFPKAFGQYRVTGWEYLIAVKHGLIQNEIIDDVRVFKAKIEFGEYVRKWFAHKEKYRPRRTTEERAQYTIGKIMMNSLYGKLAQNPTRYFDYKICSIGAPVDDENGWEKYTIFMERQIQRRSVQWTMVEKYGVDWVKRPLFYNVATGASITGLARANLLDAMCMTGRERVIYCDTDSITLRGHDPPPLDLSSDLGAWDCEGRGPVGYFAGKKLYAIQLEGGKQKTASKGSKLTFDEIRRVSQGETISWRSDAPTFSLANGVSFVHRDIRATTRVSN